MAWYVLFGMLAAFGALTALWSLLVVLLPRDTGCILVCVEGAQWRILSRWKWLNSLGLLRCTLLFVNEEEQLCRFENIERCSWEQLFSRLEMERNRIHGTGNGNHSGRDQRRDLSEL